MQPGGTEKIGDLPTAKAAIKEQLGHSLRDAQSGISVAVDRVAMRTASSRWSRGMPYSSATTPRGSPWPRPRTPAHLRRETTSTGSNVDHGPRVLLTVEAAAAQLSISRTRMYSLLKTGDVTSVRVGRLRRIPATALEVFAAQLHATQHAA